MNATLDDFRGAANQTEPAKNDGGIPAFEDVDTDEEIIAWSRERAEELIDEHEMEIELSLVNWTTSGDTKRQAAAVGCVSPHGAKPGVPIDWEKTRERLPENPTSHISEVDDIKGTVLKLSPTAFEKFDQDEWERTLKHELIHIEEHQKYGKTSHGVHFKSRAREIDASISSPKIADAKYHLLCQECGELQARRYRKSKTVKQPEKYRSGCCGAPLEVEPGPEHPDNA